MRAGQLTTTLPPDAISGGDYFQVAALRASPDGQHLAIVGYGNEGESCDVLLYRIKGWQPGPSVRDLRVPEADRTYIHDGLWSPDGKQIAVQLYTVGTDGQSRRFLRILDTVHGGMRPLQIPDAVTPLAWCDDRGDSRLVMLQHGTAIIAVDPATGAVTRLITIDAGGVPKVLR